MKNSFLRFVYLLSRYMQVVSGTALVFMMMLTSCDVIGRIFGRPIIGTYEIVSFSGALVIGFATPITTWLRGHIFVDTFTAKLPKSWQNGLNVITRLMSMIIFIILGWNLFILAGSMVRSGEVSMTLQFPFYPFAYALGVVAFIECLVFIADWIKIAGGDYA